MKAKKKILTWAAVLLGAVFVLLAILYWTTPAGSLPLYVPGYEAGSDHIHFKHGLGSFFLALALFAYAWFKSAE